MDNDQEKTVYRSPIPLNVARIQAAAVYCSDGRFGEHVDDFLYKALRLPRYDRLVVPGGAACLAGHFLAFREEEAIGEQLRFLIHAHQIRRVVLIAHQDCAYYVERLHIPAPKMEAQQLADLEKIAARVCGLGANLLVDAFFARKTGDTVCFEAVPLASTVR